MSLPNQLDPFDDGLILIESGQTTNDAIHSLWLTVNAVLQLPRKFMVILDQWQSFNTGFEHLRVGAADRVKIAQSFSPVNDGTLTAVDINLVRQGTIAAAKNVWFTIEADVAGIPSGIALATSATLDPTTIGSGGEAAYVFAFNPGASLLAGNTYWLVFQGDYTVSAVNYIGWYGVNVDRYARGASKLFDGTNWAASASFKDQQFKIYMQVRVT